jgi:hypothetical protein
MLVDYFIVPRNRVFWIEASEGNGPRRRIERFDSEEAASRPPSSPPSSSRIRRYQ